jgi:tripartite-type tricarboxylate transporter receptor subunit TctC
MIESGLAGFSGFYWNGVLAPVRTPASVVSRLNAVITEGLNSIEMRQTITKLGMEARTGTPQEFADLIAAEIKKWTSVARAANLTVD